MKTIRVLALIAIATTWLASAATAQVVWSEDFTGQNGKGWNGTVLDTNGVTWAIENYATADGFQVVDEKFVLEDLDDNNNTGGTNASWISPAIDVEGYSDLQFSVDLEADDAAYETADKIIVSYTIDGGATQEAHSVSGDNLEGGYAEAVTETIGAATTLTIRISMWNNSADELLGFDNVIVQTAPSNLPPEITIDPANLSPVLTVGQTYDITVVASEPDGNMVTLGASSLPSGANFSPNPTSAVSSVTNTFSWTPTAKESENVTFTTSDDADGAGSPVTVNFSVKDASSIMITEIIQDPSAVSDNLGEWFEIYNQSRTDIDINGWTIKDDGSNEHVIDNGGPLVVPAWDFLVLGKDANTVSNGNVTLDYEYGGSITLGNTSDAVVLMNASSQEMARVNYDDGATFPDPTGASMYLTDPNLDQNTGANWATSTTPWPGSAGDFGSPGEPNEQGDWSAVIPGSVFIIR